MARPATAAVRLLTGEREPVRLASTANIDVDAGGLLTVDGVLTEVGDRVLVKDQTDGSENGIRTVSAGQWYRASDARTNRTMQKGTTVHVQQGTANAGKTFVFNTFEPVIGDTDIEIVFYQSDDQIGEVNDALAAGLDAISDAEDASVADVEAAGVAAVADTGAAAAAAIAELNDILSAAQDLISAATPRMVKYIVGTASGAYDGVSLNTFPAVYLPGAVYLYLTGDFITNIVATNGSSVTVVDDADAPFNLPAGSEVVILSWQQQTILSLDQYLLFGTGVPGAGLGLDGAVYIDDDTGDAYTKAAGAWTLAGTFSGPAGAAATLSIVNTTTGAPGTDAAVTNVGTSSAAQFSFVIPAGSSGTNGTSFTWRTTYSGATPYATRDTVYYQGSSWIAKTATTGNAPPTLPTTTNTWWDAVAIKGTDGAGTGDVVGPASAVDSHLAVFDTTTGKLLKDGGTVASLLNTTAKATPIDADRVYGGDSTASFGLVYGTWTNVKAFLKTYFDTLYQAIDAQLSSLVRQNSQSAAYTLVLTDGGKHIFHPSADTTARIWTIPANASVAFPRDTPITFVNQNGAGVITIAITTDTMRLAGAGTTGSRTLAANGIATALKVTSTEWIISGVGLT